MATMNLIKGAAAIITMVGAMVTGHFVIALLALWYAATIKEIWNNNDK